MSDDTGGYQTNRIIAELYDQVVPYRERADVDFFVDAALAGKGPVLEIGCGTGRVLIPTARAGVTITGLDRSEYMLQVCQDHLRKETSQVRKRVQLVLADMRNFSLDKTYALATLPFRPFQHLLSVQDQINCLITIRNHLKPGGGLILDIFNPSLEQLTKDNLGEEISFEPKFTTPEGIHVQRTNKTVSRDLLQQVLQVELIYYLTHPDGRKERLVHAFPLRYLFRYEAEHLLVRCGYEIKNVYADYQKNPCSSVYPGDLIFVARKMD